MAPTVMAPTVAAVPAISLGHSTKLGREVVAEPQWAMLQYLLVVEPAQRLPAGSVVTVDAPVTPPPAQRSVLVERTRTPAKAPSVFRVRFFFLHGILL